MGLFSALNKGKRFDFELEKPLPKDHYMSLAELAYGKVFKVRSIYMNRKSKFGDHYVVLAEEPAEGKDGAIYGINLPKFNNETVIGILNNDEMVAAINAGKCGIQKGEERHGENGDYITTVWVDLE